MPPRLNEIAEDGRLAKLPARLQPVQTFDQDEAFAVLPDEDRRLLPHLQHALGDHLHLRGLESGAPRDRHIDVRNRQREALHHRVASSPRARPELTLRWISKISSAGYPTLMLLFQIVELLVMRHDDLQGAVTSMGIG